MESEKTVRVLVVHGQDACVRSLSTMIDDDTVQVLSARTEQEALTVLAEQEVALILAARELHLPEALASRSETYNPPVLMLTPDPPDREALSAAYARGITDVLVEPVDPVILKNKLRIFLTLYRLNHSDTPAVGCDGVLADLAGGLAHQFNNSLNVISGNMELLRMEQPDNADVIQFTDAAIQAVRHMAGLTEKLLAYARVGGYQTGQVEFNGLLKQVVSGFCPAPGRILVETRLDPGAIQVTADPDQLRLVFSALLKNAAEAIDGSGRITVSTRYITDVDRPPRAFGDGFRSLVCLDVADTGQGMDPETRARLFQPFFSTKFQGRGLDMAAVQGIVSHYKGVIDVETRPGKGTRVRIFFPVIDYQKAVPADLSSVRAPATVMVIDDDACVRTLTVTMLNRLGYPVIAAASGREALERLEQGALPPQLALLDMDMPGMSGQVLFPHLVRLCPDLKVVVCSGYTRDASVQELMALGAHAFLQKPFSMTDLAGLVQSLIERRRFTRYEVGDGLAVFFWESETHRERLIDLSMGGASIPTVGNCAEPDLWRELSIEDQKGAFRITDIPFQFIVPGPFARINPRTEKGPSRQSMRFGELSEDQSRRVGEFIARCAR